MPNDYTGKTHGYLTAIEPTTIRKRQNIVWKFQCKCGNFTFKIPSDVFRSSSGIQCGCNDLREKDILGNKYGMLTAVEKLDNIPGYGYSYKFKCDCGNYVDKIGHNVQRLVGRLNCGCVKNVGGNNKNNLTNKRFGNLLVLRASETNRYRGQLKWICKCDCGNEIEVFSYKLTRQRKTNCGCIKNNIGNNCKSFKGHGDIYKSYWNSIVNGAYLRGFEFDITIEFAWDLYNKQQGLCAISGVPIKCGNVKQNKTASLDRIDSSKGYVPDNIHWVHKDINAMKMNKNIDDFIEWCIKIAEFQQRRLNK